LKGNVKLIETLNSLLADELTAINHHMLHAEMCANWGYEKLHTSSEKRAAHLSAPASPQGLVQWCRLWRKWDTPRPVWPAAF
jgi:hypothetical protein